MDSWSWRMECSTERFENRASADGRSAVRQRGVPSPPDAVFENTGVTGPIFDSKRFMRKILKLNYLV